MKRWKGILPVAFVAVFATMLFGMYFKVNAKTNDKQISEGIYIESVHIGGMTEAEAKEALEAYIETLNETQFTFTAGDKQLSATAAELGFAVTNKDIVKEAMSVGKTGSLLKRYKDLADLEQGDLVFDLNVSIDKEMVTAFLNDNISKITVNSELSLDSVLVGVLVIMLSYVFRYGEQLQQQADETL